MQYILISVFCLSFTQYIILIGVETPQKSDFFFFFFLDHHETLRPYSERLWHSMTKRCSFFEASQRSEAAEHTDGSGRKVDPGFFNPSSGSKSSVTFSQSEATFLPKIKDKIDMR